MYVGQYYKVVKPIEINRGWVLEGKILYCYHKVGEDYYFYNVNTARLACILTKDSIQDKLVKCTDVDKLMLLYIHRADILQSILPIEESLTVAAKYVVNDLVNKRIELAYNAICNESDKLRDTELGEVLRMHCIAI